MIKKYLKKYKELIVLLAITTVIFIAMMMPYAIKGLPFEYGGDLKPTYFPLYQEFERLMVNFVKNGKMPFYSWDLFLGNNFWASKSFYILGDIYYYISLIFSVLFNAKFYTIFAIQTYLKLIVSVTTFYFLCNEFKFDLKVKIILPLCYGFSSWAFFFLGQPMFISCYSFIPLYILGMERYIRSNKKILFIISTALVLFTNYYLFFALSMFSPFYFTCRYYLIKGSFKGFFKNTFILIGYYFIGVSITMILTLPSFIYILQNDRVGTFYPALIFDNFKIYMHQLQSLFVPSQLIIYHDYNLFETGTHVTRELCMWAGSISAIFISQVFFDKDKNYRIAMSVFCVILGLTLVIPSGDMAMLGFSSPSFRWVYLIIIINLLVAGRYLSNYELINKKVLIITTIVIGVICLFNVPLTLIIDNSLDEFSKYLNLEYLNVLSFIFISLMVVCILKQKNYKKMLTIILALTIVELSFYNVRLIGFDRRNDNSTWEFIDNATHVLEDNPNELNNYLDSFDDNNYSSYYRVYVPLESLYWDYSHNHNLHYQIQGVMTYDSTYAPSFNDMKRIAPDVKAFDSEWIFNIKNPILVDFLNVKYAVVLDEKELPHENFELIDDNYRGGIKIYENKNYRSVGLTMGDIISYSELADKNNDLNYLLDHVVCNDEDYSEIKKLIKNGDEQLGNIDYHDNYFYGNVESEEGGFMVLNLPFDEGWNLKINGVDTKVYKVNGGMMGFEIGEGYNEIQMSFMPMGFKWGAIISCAGLAILTFIVVKDMAKKGKYEK